jgi:hypothetical protein
MVAPRALAWNREARHPAARSRLQVIAAQVSQTAFAVNDPDVISSPQFPVRDVHDLG